MTHGDDELMTHVVRANMDAIRKFGRELELCPECYYLTMVVNLLYSLIQSGALTEDEIMTELQSMVTSFRTLDDEAPENRTIH